MNDLRPAEDLTLEAARSLTAEIQRGMQGIQQLIIAAYRGRVWLVLGYPTWNDYCDGELAGARPELPVSERRELVGELRQAGMSTPAIAGALGVSNATAWRDTSSFEEVSPERVTGMDGKDRPARKPQPMPEPVVWSAEESSLRDQMEAGRAVVASLRGTHARLIDWAERSRLHVRVDRRTVWGNPFETPADGDRLTVIRNYEDHYLPYKPSLHVIVEQLRGKVLGCWCAPEPCHGDVLARMANR